MPRGTPHEVVGLLMKAGRSLTLEIDGGGSWRLEAPWRRTSHLLGRRVRVVGIRDGFDLLAVQSIDAV